MWRKYKRLSDLSVQLTLRLLFSLQTLMCRTATVAKVLQALRHCDGGACNWAVHYAMGR